MLPFFLLANQLLCLYLLIVGQLLIRGKCSNGEIEKRLCCIIYQHTYKYYTVTILYKQCSHGQAIILLDTLQLK